MPALRVQIPQVDDYVSALQTLCTVTLRTVIGEYTLDALLVNRAIISAPKRYLWPGGVVGIGFSG